MSVEVNKISDSVICFQILYKTFNKIRKLGQG